MPGSPRWEYRIETGCGPHFCHLTDRVNGEEISVELDADEGGEGHFIITDILSHWARQQREGATARMLRLHPVINSVLYARTDLLELGYLEEVGLDEDTGFVAERLTPAVIDHVRAIKGFTEAWQERSHRLWLSALIGDWPAAATAAEEAGDPELIAITGSRADRCRALRLARIRSGPAYYPGEYTSPELRRQGEALSEIHRGGLPFLGALHQVDGAELDAHVRRALKEDTWEGRSAVRFLVDLQDASLCDDVDRFFHRAIASGSEDLLDLDLLRHCARYLARHGYRTEATISSMGDVDLLLDEAVLLALEYAPGLVLELVRRGLRSPADGVSRRVAATLALIDRPWSRHELISALGDSEAPEQAPWCRMALQESCDPEARPTVEEGETTQFGDGPGYPCDDEEESDHLLDPAEHFRYAMERLRDRVAPLRARNPA